MSTVARWLEQLGLGRYTGPFAENDIDDEVLVDLSEGDLERLGVSSLGHRKKLLKAIAALRTRAGQDAATTTPSAHVPTDASAAERRQLTVMFCDLVGSTELSQRLDPEDLRELITVCQLAWQRAIERYGGFVARYMGDGVLAYFGFPQAHEDDAERALHAALDLVASMAEVNSRATRTDLALSVRVGVATGLAVVGDVVGEGASKESPVVGETPNLAARLQGSAEPDTVVVNDLVQQLGGDTFACEDLGPRRLKGIAEPVHAWRVVGRRAAQSRFAAGHAGCLTPLVGREHELGLLLERWEQAKTGEGQVLVLSGEAGVGKSRVSQTLHRRLGAGAHVCSGYQCSPHHSHSALYPLLTRIERDAGFEPDDAPAVRLQKLEHLHESAPGATERYVPTMAALLSVPTDGRYPNVDLSTRRQREQMLRMLAAYIAELGRGQPLLVLFEDVHWADATSLELLEIVIEQVQRCSVFLLVTTRPEFESPWTSHTHVTSLTLNRLSRRWVASMVRSIAQPRPLSDAVVTQVVAKSDGNPLFAEELTRSVLESGSASASADLSPGEAALSLDIPATLHDSLMARLDRVPMAREVAQCAAVIGREFSREFLAAVVPLSKHELATALGQLVEAEVVFKRGASADDLYIFKHALVRDAAYESLLKRRRRDLHLQIAHVLRDRMKKHSSIGFELIAHHFTQAHAYPEAIEYWQKAGARAAERCANREAAEHFRHGIGLLAEVEDTVDSRRQELSMQVSLGSVLESTQGFAAPGVGEAHRRAQALCEQLGDTEQLTRALYGLAHFHMVRAELITACRIGERCLDLANELQDPGYLVDARLVLGGSLGHRGQLDAARKHLEGGLAQYGADRHTAYTSRLALDTDVFGRSFLGHVFWLLGYSSRAREQLSDAVAVATAHDDPFSTARAWAYSTMLCQFMYEVEETMQSAAQTIVICEEHHFEYYVAWGQLMHAWAADQLGGDSDATTELQAALARLLRTGAGLRRSYYLALLAQSYGAHGRTAEGLSLVAQGLEDVAQTDERWAEPELYRTRGLLLLKAKASALDDAEQSLRRAVRCAETQGALSLQLRATVDLAQLIGEQGRRAEAQEILGGCYNQFTEGLDTVDLKAAKRTLEGLA